MREPRESRWAAAIGVAAAALALAGASPAVGQVFLATKGPPTFAIGPLFILATVTPDLASVGVRASWALTPARDGSQDLEQDLYVIWPAELVAATAPGPGEPELRRFVEGRGFDVMAEGRLLLRVRTRAQLGTAAEGDPVGATAPFVTFFRRGTNPAQSGVWTFIKMPWTPRLAEPTSLTSVSMRFKDLLTPKPATWVEELFWGRRHVLNIGVGTAGSVPLYALYLDQRDRVVPLARDFSLLIANFDDADHLRVEEISPPAATRRPSRVRAGAENITLPLNAAEGSVPQVLRVQFSYFSGRIAWRPIVISLLFLVLGNVMGAVMFAQEVSRFLRRRLALGRGDGSRRVRGAVLGDDVLDQLVPGVTTRDEVVALCGPPDEERARMASDSERVLVYRSSRAIVHPRRRLGWVSTVGRREEEHREVEISFAGDRVRNVETRVRRARVP